MTTKTTSVGRGRGEMWVVAQLTILTAIAFAPPSEEWPENLRTISTIAGIIIAGIGLIIIAASAARLRSSLTIYPRPLENGRLTRLGMYSVVRHPMYLGVILCTLGWVVLRASTLGLILVMLLSAFFNAKASREEIWLAEKYDEYAEYQREVSKLIPFIY